MTTTGLTSATHELYCRTCGTIWLSVVVDDEQDDSWNLPGSDYCCGQLVNAWRILDGEVERVDDRLR